MENAIFDIPLLPLRDVVVFPFMAMPLFVGRLKSVVALEAAMSGNKKVILVTQKIAGDNDPGAESIYDIGTISNVLQLLKLPDGTVKVLVEGVTRARVQQVRQHEGYLSADVAIISDEASSKRESEVMIRSIMTQFEQYIKMSRRLPPELITSLAGIEELGRLVDSIMAHMPLKLEDKQVALELFNPRARAEYLMGMLENEVDLLNVEKRIRSRVKKQMEKTQREYYLNEQIKAIQKELGELDDAGLGNESSQLHKKIEAAGMPAEAKKKALTELNKLKMMAPASAEATVVRGYIDWMISVPWNKRSRIINDLSRAENILHKDHYGLDDVKERILEYLAVQTRTKKANGPILCLVGPPGVGKTSLGKSIARATNRKFVRMALGGVRDEAEIRGHRRTYIGSLPGKIIQKLSKVGVKNPLFLLDEVDKMALDMRGDPAAALLEVLDPEQNNAFNDHYLDVDYDLSEVMFVCTSNSLNIPAPLLDRMEVIRIPGYTEEEKLNIANNYLIPRAREKNGLKEGELELTEDAVRDLVRYYTREAGVRNLEREIDKVCRKVVRDHVQNKNHNFIKVDTDELEGFSGVRKHNYGRAGKEDRVGQVTGLAWTSVGGDLLTIEAAAMPGKGKHVRTGSLGDVMQESIQAALTVVRSRAHLLGIKDNINEKYDIHIHVPEGATPKDGPSAGIAMCTALVSVLTNIPVRATVAMTGEITLRGEVLPIGGLKEKLLAAHRGGMTDVIIPKENQRDLKEIPDNIKKSLNIHAVEWIDEVLGVALSRMPEPVVLTEEVSLSAVLSVTDEEIDSAVNQMSRH